MEIGICTVMADSFGEWPAYLDLLDKVGIRWIEVWADGHLPREPLALSLLKGLFQSRGMKAVSVHAAFGAERDHSSLDKSLRHAAVKNSILTLERTASLGAEFMVYHPSFNVEEPNERPDRKKWGQDSLARVAARARELEVKLAVENMPPGYLASSKNELEEFVAPFPKESVGVCLDTGHMNMSGLGPDDLDGWEGRIISFHIHDNNGSGDDHLIPGRGTVDWPALGRKLVEIGFSGPLMLECPLPDKPHPLARVKGLLGI